VAKQPRDFDAVVVGSGFGGSVSAYRLAEAGQRVCLLERGKAFPPGSFPRTPREMAGNFWDPSEGGHGLFQIWAFPGIESVVSAGLGGGSLIYANVLIRKDEKWFATEVPGKPGYEYWPVTRDDLDPHYSRVETMLAPQRYPFDQEPYRDTPKTIAFAEAADRAGLDWSLPDLAVTFANQGGPAVPGEPIIGVDGTTTGNLHGRTRYTCRLVGECDVGCNYGSKNSLDFNYLTEAKRLGVDIRTLSEVRAIRPLDGGGYAVDYIEHEPASEGRRTDSDRLPVHTLGCDRLVLSAGVFGTNYLLLKNHPAFPNLSRWLGIGFSGNGDLLGFARHPKPGRDLGPMTGPVITSTVRVDDATDGGDGPGYYIQEGGFPQFLGWALEAGNVPSELERVAHFGLRQAQAALSRDPRSDLSAEVMHLLGDTRSSSEVMLMLGMGRDRPTGRMSMNGKWLQLDWSVDDSRAYFDRVRKQMKAIATNMGCDFTINPLWYLRKLVTVHGLGGCRMGRTADEGVVDSFGEVFNYPGLFVADGSVMPGPVGPNPSLTIAALADRFADRMTGAVQGTQT
jgi:cholesterol oxidase